MTTQQKIQHLERLIKDEENLQDLGRRDPIFINWKIKVKRTLITVFGDNSLELKEFDKLDFSYNTGVYIQANDDAIRHKEEYARDFDSAIRMINQYIEDFKYELENEEPIGMEQKMETSSNKVNKIFISHSKKDKDFVEEIIELLETIGLKSNQIFCSSFEGYGIELGQDFLQKIKQELDSQVLVLFILSENFYNSPICLCEMGATWIKTNQHIPILIPPFEFNDIKGVIPHTQGFKINDKSKINLFKQNIENNFTIKSNNDFTLWERKRDNILKRINDKLGELSQYKSNIVTTSKGSSDELIYKKEYQEKFINSDLFEFFQELGSAVSKENSSKLDEMILAKYISFEIIFRGDMSYEFTERGKEYCKIYTSSYNLSKHSKKVTLF